mgnify:CR=1 FL=1
MNDSQLPVPAPSKEVRQWAMLCHFAAFLGLVFPFGSLLGPLILWQFKKDMDPLIDDQGKEALNFQITVAIADDHHIGAFLAPLFGERGQRHAGRGVKAGRVFAAAVVGKADGASSACTSSGTCRAVCSCCA